MGAGLNFLISLWVGLLLDLLLGDPEKLPHPIVGFGKAIERAERVLNKGPARRIKGILLALLMSGFTFAFFSLLLKPLEPWPYVELAVASLFVFYGLSVRSLVQESVAVFRVLEREGLEKARKQVSRIVGRDTKELSEEQVKAAVLETMAENLSDGVVAPITYYAIAGVPGIMTYKMVNTLDSMIGYKDERYGAFGWGSARLDDLLNFVPSRITALLMALVSLSPRGLRTAIRDGKEHKSPNAGHPEAALAGILDLRFGGPHTYRGSLLKKPYIGRNPRRIIPSDLQWTIGIHAGVTFLSATIVSTIWLAT